MTKSSPVSLAVPTRRRNGSGDGAVGERSQRECPVLLSTVTRWQIGGSGFSDSAAPPTPFLDWARKERGTLDLSGVSFGSLTDTETISAATLAVYYWNELQGVTSFALASAIGEGDTALTLNAAGPAQVGSVCRSKARCSR